MKTIKLSLPKGSKVKQNGDELIVEVEEVFELQDGDIVYWESINYNIHGIMIFKGYPKTNRHYANFFLNSGSLSIDSYIENSASKRFEIATKEQKQILFDALAKEGLKWNSIEKKIEKIRWRAKVGDDYWTISSSGDIESLTEENDGNDNEFWNYGNYFRTEEIATSMRNENKKRQLEIS
jgi:hypothetical protein